MGKNGALTKDNPARRKRDLTIAQGRLQGKTYRELAAEFGVSKQQIHTILHDEEVKAVVDTGTRLMVGLVPKAVDNYKVLLDDADSKIRLAASKDVCTNAGILPSHMQSLTINNIINSTSVEVSSELGTLSSFIADQLRNMSQEPDIVQDAEVIDDTQADDNDGIFDGISQDV